MPGKRMGLTAMKRWTELNDRKLMLLALGNPSHDYTALAAHFDGPTGKPASAKAIEERLAKLKREGRAIAAEKGGSATTTTATPDNKTKKGIATAKKETGAKRKAHLREEYSEEEGDEELDLGETDKDEDIRPAKKTKSGKTEKEDKTPAKKAKLPGFTKPKIGPTGPKRVTYSDDEGEEVGMEATMVGDMEVDLSSGKTNMVKREDI